MIIDLTMDVSENTLPFPGSKGIEIRSTRTVDEHGSNVRRVTLGTHFGTHIDAPYHMLAHGKKLDEYDANTFVGEAIVLDVKGVDKITEEHVPSEITAPILIFKTGHSDKGTSKEYFEQNPVLTPGAAQAIVRTNVRIVGIDSPTVDNPPYTVHKIFFEKEILILENLIDLEKVGDRCRLTVAPLKLTNADGAPTRVFAEV